MGKNNPGDLFDSMVKEAMDEVGNDGWKKASQNAVTLAAFGMMADKVNKRISRLVKPVWIIGVSMLGSALWYIISGVLGV